MLFVNKTNIVKKGAKYEKRFTEIQKELSNI